MAQHPQVTVGPDSEPVYIYYLSEDYTFRRLTTNDPFWAADKERVTALAVHEKFAKAEKRILKYSKDKGIATDKVRKLKIKHIERCIGNFTAFASTLSFLKDVVTKSESEVICNWMQALNNVPYREIMGADRTAPQRSLEFKRRQLRPTATITP